MKSRFGKIRLRYQITVLVRLLLLAVSIAALQYVAISSQLFAVSLVLALVVVGQIAALLTYTSSEHRKLERFLDALDFDDLSLQLVEEDWDRQLARAANHILGTVREARSDTEAQANYLDALVKHVPAAILSYRPSGEIVLINNAARQMFAIPRLNNMQGLAALGAHLPEQLMALEPGQQRLIRAADDNRVLDLKVSVTEIRMGGDQQTLLALENIHGELDDREITAWRDLIRVLTHEIMNSITPIASLARTVDALVSELRNSGTLPATESEQLRDMHTALATIGKRSDGLLEFVDGYRRLTGIPQPNLKKLKISVLLDEVVQLGQQLLSEYEIDLRLAIEPPSLSVSADDALLQQVLINLLKNAVHAVKDAHRPEIKLSAQQRLGRVNIQVSDNGCGIPADEISQIFIPFFTTKKHGSGVGMTLARQIMSAHGGSVSVRSQPGSGTVVTLVF